MDLIGDSHYNETLRMWSRSIEYSWRACVRAGLHIPQNLSFGEMPQKMALSRPEGHCMPVFYELLVKKPERWLRRIFEYIGLPFNPDVLRHQDFVGQRIRVSKYWTNDNA